MYGRLDVDTTFKPNHTYTRSIDSDNGIMLPDETTLAALDSGSFSVLDPKFWRDHEEPDLVTWSSGNRQAFANRFAVNYPLRTCDMHQTLIGLLHYSFEVFTSGGPVLDGRDYGPWVPITVGPWE